MLVSTFGVVLGAGAVHAGLVGHYRLTTPSRIGWDIAYAALLALTGYAAGLPERAPGKAAAVGQAVTAVGAGAVGISLVQTALGSLLLPRFVVVSSATLLVMVYVACADLSLREQAAGRRRERIVVVAEQEEVDVLVQDLGERTEQPAALIAAASLSEVHGRGSESQPLIELVDRTNPTVLVLDRRAAADDSVVAQAAVLHERGIRVRTLSLFYEEWMGKLPVTELERVGLMFDIGELHRARYGRIKRILDVVIALAGVALAALALPLVLLVNAGFNRGPLFFRQQRVGKGGRIFTMLKFRTCRSAALSADEASEWIAEDDPRVTPGGALLRRLHIDELPNFVNVLKGDMTLVGPRPEQPGYVQELEGKLPFYSLRHLVRPGLTGWAQVNYGYASDYAGAVQKLQYDFYYLRHQGYSLDLRVAARSIRAVFWSGR